MPESEFKGETGNVTFVSKHYVSSSVADSVYVYKIWKLTIYDTGTLSNSFLKLNGMCRLES